MSQYNNQRSTGAGRSRAKGSSHGSRAQSHGTGRTGSSAARTGSAQRGRKSAPRHRGGPDYDFKKIAIGGVILIAAIACIVFLMKGIGGKAKGEDETETTTIEETELQKEVTVDGISITGMSREDAKAAILKNYPWAMKVTYQDDTYDVSDLMAGKVDALLGEIYAGEPKESYTLDTHGLEEAVQAEAAAAAARWDKKAKNGSISSYDASSDKFLFTGAESGLALDQEKLALDIASAIKAKDFDASIEAVVNPVEPEFSEEVARERYKTLASFTTKTTANSKRNTNVKLSAQAINGKILHPGEEFSFNGVVGERTEAKGYKGAAAYNNGEVVEEIGGGVCQVSSTLYNVVLRAGLKTTVRRSHTFEPSYVTPGCDATVSWNGPDYKFVNNTSAAIGIRASYYDQTVTISIYGIPVLEEGVKYTLESKKIKDMDPPAPTYEEDPTLEPGIEKTKSSGSLGSYWETRLVITKNGEVVSREVDHNTTYKGHPAVILRNTSGSVAPTQPSETGESTIDPSMIESTPAPEGAGDGFGTLPGPGESQGVSAGPGMSGTTAAPGPGPGTTATLPAQSQAPAPTTPAATAPAATAPTEAPAPTTPAPQPEAPSAQPPAPSPDDVQVIAPNPMS